MTTELVTVIIPTYNRFKYLLHAIRSVKEQTYKNIEIIVINDCSTQEEYYNFDFKKEFGDNIYILNLPKNSKSIYGFSVPGGHQRNFGMMLAKSTYIAFLDDDDYFLPTKIEKQVFQMKKTNCFISCTEGFIGKELYDPTKKYNIYHYKGHYWGALKNIFKRRNKEELLEHMFKDDINIWTEDSYKTHNCAICSSVMINKDIIKKAGYFPIKNTADDYAYWLQIIKHTNCVFLREPLIYYDNGHGSGRNYK